MAAMNEITVYLNTMLCMATCVQYSRAIQLASKIEYELHPGDEYYQWIDQKSLYRLVLRLKLGIRLLMAVFALISCLNRFYPHLIVYQTGLITYSSLCFFLCMFLDSNIMFLTYSKSDFSFLNIRRIKKNSDEKEIK